MNEPQIRVAGMFNPKLNDGRRFEIVQARSAEWPMSRMLILTLVTIFCLGCGEQNRPSYKFHFHNFTGKERVQMDIAPRQFEWGKLRFMAPVGGSMGFYDNPVPEEATLSWTEDDGRDYRVVVPVPKLTPEELNRIYIFYVVSFPNREVKIAGFTKEEYRAKDKVNEFRANGQPIYAIGIRNQSDQALTRMSLRFGKLYAIQETLTKWKASDRLRNNGWYHWNGNPFPVTDTAVIGWVTSDGTAHEQTVEMKSHFPSDLNGQTLCFDIDAGNTVTFDVRPYKDRKSWFWDGSPLDPPND